MKIGILTFWGVPNYGSFFQAYALRGVVLKLRPDAEVEVIPYLNRRHYKTYYGLVNNPSLRALFSLSYYKNVLNRICKHSEIKKMKDIFITSYSELSSAKTHITSCELEQTKYDMVILGSDIIWDYTIKFFGEEPYLFGGKLDAERIISYAASFGTAPLNDKLPDYVKTGINILSAVSVRDEKSYAIVNNNFSFKSLVVPDPTLLWEFQSDKRFDIENEYGDYIVVYGSTFPKHLIAELVEYKEKNNYKVICLDSGGDFFDWCDINISQSELTPYTWAGMIKNAKLVMTCTFHGLMFGLLFQKKIVFYATDFILPKISSIIKELDIEEPLLSLENFHDKLEWKWNYDEITKKIKKIREKGMLYLEENLLK